MLNFNILQDQNEGSYNTRKKSATWQKVKSN